jgi:hypothetical protein
MVQGKTFHECPTVDPFPGHERPNVVVTSADEIPRRPIQKPDIFIVNTDLSSGPGKN